MFIMVAHNFGVGTFRENDAHVENSLSPNTCDSWPGRGRAKQHVPAVTRQGASQHLMQLSLGSDLRATAPEFIPLPPQSANSEAEDPTLICQTDPATNLLDSTTSELDMYGIPWFYYMYQVQIAYHQGFQNGRSRSPKKSRQKKQQSAGSTFANIHQPKSPITEQTPGQEQRHMSTMPLPASGSLLSEQPEQQKRDNFVENVVASKESPHLNESDAGDRAYSPFAAQKATIARQTGLRNTTDALGKPNIDITTIRNVALPHERRYIPGLNSHLKTMPNRGNYYNNNRRYHNHSDNGLYSYGGGGGGMIGVPMHHTVPFPTPMPPQGRPAYSTLGIEACGVIDIVVAAERGGGDACHTCEPDHPLD
jgi:hypothetical protein